MKFVFTYIDVIRVLLYAIFGYLLAVYGISFLTKPLEFSSLLLILLLVDGLNLITKRSDS